MPWSLQWATCESPGLDDRLLCYRQLFHPGGCEFVVQYIGVCVSPILSGKRATRDLHGTKKHIVLPDRLKDRSTEKVRKIDLALHTVLEL